MPSVSVFFSSSSALLRGPPRIRRLLASAATRAHSSAAGASRSRGELPRFHTPSLPSSKVNALVYSSASSPPPPRHFVERPWSSSAALSVCCTTLPRLLNCRECNMFCMKHLCISLPSCQFLRVGVAGRGCSLVVPFRGLILVLAVTENIITLQGEVIRIQGDEFWHMTRVLRLGVNDRFLSLLFFFFCGVRAWPARNCLYVFSSMYTDDDTVGETALQISLWLLKLVALINQNCTPVILICFIF